MKCLVNRDTFPIFLEPYFEKYFDIIRIDIQKFNNSYTPKDYFVFVDDRHDQAVIDVWQDRGFKVVVEKFWEQLIDDPQGRYIENNCLHLYTKNWVWFDLIAHNRYGNYDYIRSRTQPQHFFLLLMNSIKRHRDQLFKITKDYHADSLCSYVQRHILIPGDVPATGHGACAGTSDQYFYNPEWYSNTHFSLVSESWGHGHRFISEKIFKPLAFQHPFVVYGTAGTLRFLRESGFETFDHVIDESYDEIVNSVSRLSSIEVLLKELYHEYQQGSQLFADAVSQQKILHNYHNFYSGLDRLWLPDIIDPIREFVNA
jgi:hypothetical protein